jgi:hypothetical protein
VKALHDADDGDARGRRHLLGGVVMALPVLPRLDHRGNPRAGLRFGRRRRVCVVTSLGASPRWFVESFVHVLESMVAAAQSAGFQGAMYTAAGAPWSTISLVGFGPAAHSPTLRR